MKNTIIKFTLCVLTVGLFLSTYTLAQSTNIVGPQGSNQFGRNVIALPNGNIVVTDPEYSIPGGADNVGAVYMYNGSTRELISTLTGSQDDDFVGIDGVTVLTNGNYVVVSSSWNNGATQFAGAVTFCSRDLGCDGTVSSANSLVGSNANDFVGDGGITPLTNGNYVVTSLRWDEGTNSDVGAVTWGNGTFGRSGVVAAANSLVGFASNERVGSGGVTALTNGNYVVSSPNMFNSIGAVTFGDGTTGITGDITSLNSLIGSTQDDRIGSLGVTPLANGNYVVTSPDWDNGGIVNAGAVTFGSGSTGVSGAVSPINSLVGSSINDQVGGSGIFPFINAVTALPNGDYVVASSFWDNNTVGNVGAVTFGDGVTGTTGTISSSNSLIGSEESDTVGSGGVTVLTNGNYVISSPNWNNGNEANVGAATFSPSTGRTGTISSANSLIGSTTNDRVSVSGITALTNGNYVVSSPNWDSDENDNVGAVTLGNGTSGVTGVVSESNSIIGATTNTGVGSEGVTALTNGNYVISTLGFNNGSALSAGAITFRNGTAPTTGTVSVSNSLVGSTINDNIGDCGITALPTGGYVICSQNWDNGEIENVGAVTFGNGTSGITGVITSANSLVGSTANDRIGSEGVMALPSFGYVFSSPNWDNGAIANVGAITCVTGAFDNIGQVAQNNSVLGSIANAGPGGLDFSFDDTNFQLVVGLRNENKVTLFKKFSISSTPFDFDGDRKTDVSIFRQSVGEWWYLRSSDWYSRALQFGLSTDKPTPADYTGDGKTDIGFYRYGEWFILRSEDNSFFSFPFGDHDDIPAPGDYDGDGKADPAVFRPSNSTWFILKSTDNNVDIIPFGIPEDKPVVADYDGDGRDDIAIFRPSVSQWWINQSNDGVTALQFGNSGDRTVQGDFTGDGKADVAFWRPMSGEWFIIRSEDFSFFSFPFGADGDIPAPGDYDGDGIFDATVFRPSNTTWFMNTTSNGVQILGFGSNDDIPVPTVYSYPFFF